MALRKQSTAREGTCEDWGGYRPYLGVQGQPIKSGQKKPAIFLLLFQSLCHFLPALTVAHMARMAQQVSSKQALFLRGGEGAGRGPGCCQGTVVGPGVSVLFCALEPRGLKGWTNEGKKMSSHL